jgi:hypothetical protein
MACWVSEPALPAAVRAVGIPDWAGPVSVSPAPKMATAPKLRSSPAAHHRMWSCESISYTGHKQSGQHNSRQVLYNNNVGQLQVDNNMSDIEPNNWRSSGNYNSHPSNPISRHKIAEKRNRHRKIPVDIPIDSVN